MNPNLNRHLPPYMPRQEALLLIWIEQFLNGLKPMLGLFQIEQQDYEQYMEGFGSLKNAYDCHVHSDGLAKANTRFKDLVFYDRNHLTTSAPREEGVIFPGVNTLEGGYVWRLAELIEEKILPNPACSEDIKRQLQILPVAHAVPSPEQLVAEPDIVCDGSKVTIHTTIPKPADSQIVHVDKHDGKGMVKERETPKANCEYQTELPEIETLWTFKVALSIKGREVGTAAYVNVLVKCT
ncbi:MAG: hypothetical protein LBH01_00490 [Verrucomicrobiales bacterium]|jgi:hypothetical protein|nr:hypothetical protein [Verrucomicrobiales bacterium]